MIRRNANPPGTPLPKELESGFTGAIIRAVILGQWNKRRTYLAIRNTCVGEIYQKRTDNCFLLEEPTNLNKITRERGSYENLVAQTFQVRERLKACKLQGGSASSGWSEGLFSFQNTLTSSALGRFQRRRRGRGYLLCGRPTYLGPGKRGTVRLLKQDKIPSSSFACMLLYGPAL